MPFGTAEKPGGTQFEWDTSAAGLFLVMRVYSETNIDVIMGNTEAVIGAGKEVGSRF
jgi:hypothetical protein